jgi:hypothetical protein
MIFLRSAYDSVSVLDSNNQYIIVLTNNLHASVNYQFIRATKGKLRDTKSEINLPRYFTYHHKISLTDLTAAPPPE